MTCIAAIAEKGTVYMAADSAGTTAEWELVTRKDKKAFRVGPMIIGGTGSCRGLQILRWHLKPPQKGKGSADKYINTIFISAMRRCFRNHGFLKDEQGVTSAEADIIVGYEGNIFVVHSDFQVASPRVNYSAVGSGAGYALGSLYTTEGSIEGPKTRLMWALKAAETFSAAVRRPFRFITGGKIKGIR